MGKMRRSIGYKSNIIQYITKSNKNFVIQCPKIKVPNNEVQTSIIIESC